MFSFDINGIDDRLLVVLLLILVFAIGLLCYKLGYWAMQERAEAMVARQNKIWQEFISMIDQLTGICSDVFNQQRPNKPDFGDIRFRYNVLRATNYYTGTCRGITYDLNGSTGMVQLSWSKGGRTVSDEIDLINNTWSERDIAMRNLAMEKRFWQIAGE